MYIILLLDLQINTSSQESIVTKTNDLIKYYILSRMECFHKLPPPSQGKLFWLCKFLENYLRIVKYITNRETATVAPVHLHIFLKILILKVNFCLLDSSVFA